MLEYFDMFTGETTVVLFNLALERFKIVFTVNGKREIRVYVFLKK